MKNILFKSMLVPSLVFLLLSSALFLYFNNMIGIKSKELMKAQMESEEEMKTFDHIRQIERSMREISREISMFETHFVKSEDVVPFLDSLEALGQSVAVDAEITSVDVGKNNSYFNVLVRASGSFENLYKFLTLIENSKYEMDFISMDLSKLSTGSLAEWEVRLKLKLLTFLP